MATVRESDVIQANGIYQGGTPREWCTLKLKAKTLTNLRAGVFVIYDTDDAHFKAAGAAAANVVGILSRNLTNPGWDPTTAPAAEDECEILICGSGARVKARNGAALLMGDQVATSATARAAAGHASNNTTVGRVLLDSDGSGAETDVLLVI